jgi:hypothetical protein
MVTRKRLRSILTTLGLYVMAALLIGYFGVNASSPNGRSGSAAWRCCGPTGSTPICSTSRRVHCSIMSRQTISL